MNEVSMNVVSIGEVLWDVFPGQELLGGAPLNFCADLVRLGHRASILTAVGDDARGRRAVEAIAGLGVDTSFLQQLAGQPTGVALVTHDDRGEPHFSIPRPAAFDALALSPAILEQVAALHPDWLYLGTLFHHGNHQESSTRELVRALAGTRVFYDMNLRPGGWSLALVQRLCGLANLLKLNQSEAETLGQTIGLEPGTFSSAADFLQRFCALWAERYELETICVTLGPEGCFVFEHGEARIIPGFPAVVKDTVGAGDAFAAAFLHGRQLGWPLLQTARFANALGSIVASRPGAIPSWSPEECLALASTPAV